MSLASGRASAPVKAPLEPRELEAAGHAAKLLARELLGLRERVVHRDEHEVLERVDIIRIHGIFLDADLARFLRAGQHDRHRTTPGGALDGQLAELVLGLLHVRLHLARHALQVTDVLHVTRPPGCGLVCGTSRAPRGASDPRSRAACWW